MNCSQKLDFTKSRTPYRFSKIYFDEFCVLKNASKIIIRTLTYTYKYRYKADRIITTRIKSFFEVYLTEISVAF